MDCDCYLYWRGFIRGAAMTDPDTNTADDSASRIAAMRARQDSREVMRVLDLFSGIGGFSLALERTGGFQTVAFCEIEEYPRRVLAKHWPGVPIYEDVRDIEGFDCDVIIGGFPCQPFSSASAGKSRGTADDRHLWPEMRRLCALNRPRYVITENVLGLIGVPLEQVVSDLEAISYAVWTFIVPACAVGHIHRRDRVWILGHANGDSEPERTQYAKASGVPEHAAYHAGPVGGNDGLPSRMDRLRALGNAVVPQIPELIGRAILDAHG